MHLFLHVFNERDFPKCNQVHWRSQSRLLEQRVLQSSSALLGVYIDQSLTYNDHVAKTTSNCIFKLVQISRIKHLLDRKTLLLLMNAFVFSTMYYCLTAWANTSQRNIKKLQLVQNFAARIVLGFKKFDHISQGIKSLNWLTVKERLYFNDAVMVFKCVNNLVPEYLANMFVPRSHIHSRVTRSCNLLHIP